MMPTARERITRTVTREMDLEHHEPLGRDADRRGDGGAKGGRVGEADIDIVEEPGLPVLRTEVRVDHLGEEEVGRTFTSDAPSGRSTTVELPVPEAEDDDVRHPDRNPRVHELGALGRLVVQNPVDEQRHSNNVGQGDERDHRDGEGAPGGIGLALAHPAADGERDEQ